MARRASTFPSVRRRAESANGCVTQFTSVRGSMPTYASIALARICWLERNAGTANGLTLRVANRTDLIGPEQVDTPAVGARQEDDRRSIIDVDDRWRSELHAEVALAGDKGLKVLS